MRNQINSFAIAICLLLANCKEHEPIQDNFDLKPPTVVEAKAYKVLPEKIVPPKIIRASGVKEIVAGKPEIIKLTSNVFPAQPVSVMHVGSLSKNTFDKKSYQPPVTILAKDSPFIAGVPEITVIDKEFYSKDENPESFSSMSVAHGLKYE
jgi:hypothetical protein